MSKNVPLRIQTVFMADALNYPTCRVLFSCTNTGRNTNSLTQPFPPPSLTEHLTDLPRKIPSKRISPLDVPPFCLWIKRKFPRLNFFNKTIRIHSLQPANTKLHTRTHSVRKIIRQLWVWGDGTSEAGECGTGYGSLWCDCKAARKSGLIRPTDQGLTRQTLSCNHAVKPSNAHTHTKKKLFLPSSVFILNLIRQPNPSLGILFGPLTPARITHQTGENRSAYCDLAGPADYGSPPSQMCRCGLTRVLRLTSVRRSSALSWRVKLRKMCK